MASNKTLCIAEWQAFSADDIAKSLGESASGKAQKIFDELKDFAAGKNNHAFLKFWGKNRLKAQNYAGLIQTKSGFCLEILPKTFRADNENEGFENNQEKITKAKEVLLKMLATLRDSPFKQSHISNLATKNLPLLEVFAIMFLSELERLIKRGLKSDYIGREQNRRFLKGRLLFAQNLRQNLAHKERFFTAADEYTANSAPNRLIKSTLLLLAAQGFSAKTSGRILQARFVFDEISPSKNIDKDFAQSVNFRRFKDYELLLLWCAVFLRRKNFLPYQGSQNAFALLFDMNKLFESFVAWCLRRKFTRCEIKTQDKSKFLLEFSSNSSENKKNKFQLVPDIVGFTENKTKTLFIADTKWKILSNDESKNYEISQGDLYQMFAYLAKYQCQKGILIYPKIDEQNALENKKFNFKAQICFVDENGKILSKNSPQIQPQNSKKTAVHELSLQLFFFNLNENQQCVQTLESLIFA